MSINFHKKPNMYTSHIQLKVSNLERSMEFYQSTIGFKLLEKIDNIAYLSVDGKDSLVSLIEVENAILSKRGFTGLYHMALLLPTRKDLGNIIKHFIDNNVRIGAGDHHVSEALYLDDPDGNGIEIYVDRDPKDWLWNKDNVYMTTEEVDFHSIIKEADGNWIGLPEETVMGHVHLSVANIEETVKFYTQVLEYNITTSLANSAVFASTGDYHHHLAFNVWNGLNGKAATNNHVGLKSYTIVLKDSTYAVIVKDKLLVAGYTIEEYKEASKYGGAQVFSTIDPNGFRIVFTIEGK